VTTAKYARLEDEQRFVLDALPPDATNPRVIEDRYVIGSRLRVRTVTDVDSRAVVAKLGQKTREDDAMPSRVWHTTIYLDANELALLTSLPAHVLTKQRWHALAGSVDVFAGPLEGLVLFEGDRPVAPPPGAVEVTSDGRFSGGALAALGVDAARSLVGLAHELLG
jgi:CYTH domain-containing protein